MSSPSALPILASPRDKDASLQAALSRMVAADGLTLAETGDAVERHEAPADDDPHVTAVRRLPAVAAEYAAMPDAIDRRLVAALRTRGISELYTHQAASIDHALAGRHTVVVTPTASGKTLCYNAPVLSAILTDPSTRALYLFPTKALAQDQLAELHQLVQVLGLAEPDPDRLPPDESSAIGVFTYDGDTPQDARRAVRGRAHVVLSNPDMLHSGILPHHPRWAKLFENLRFVVIDELHAYRGVFGSHLANIIRRLRRVCRHYGSNPTFICSSATIANPRDLAERLVGESFELVEKSGAPRGEKFFLFVNPPVVNPELGIRRSYLAETRRVALEFLNRGLQLIVFAQSRLATEILTTYLKDACAGPPGAADLVRGYRGGYLPGRRREIERGLRNGDVRCVVSTNALELGIDIGALDVSVMGGYPGTIAATWQRAGRAGRRSGRSAAVFVASSAPIDQFVVRHPEYFFGASPEHALVNPDNLHILLDHVKCAAFELPFQREETFGTINVQEILAILAEDGFVQQTDGVWQWTQDSYPADAVSLRSVTSDNFVVVDATHNPAGPGNPGKPGTPGTPGKKDERVIGETDFTSGPATLHEKAIYLVEGQLYQVERFDFDGRKAFVRSVECDYYTTAITYSKVTILEEFRLRSAARHGEVHVASRVVGFKKIKFYTSENVGSGELDLPEQQMHTTSYWMTIPAETMAGLPFGTADRRDGVVGLAFAMRNVAPLLLMCDSHDIGLSVDGVSLAGATRLGGLDRASTANGSSGVQDLAVEPTIYLYDNYPGGIGFSEPLFGMHDELVARTRDLIDGCPCQSGCPSCVGPEGATGPRAKAVASHLLSCLASIGGAA
ncbi:MAG TPA: DEAD/DEAH box helicase [Vicinamibacterales bacterium]